MLWLFTFSGPDVVHVPSTNSVHSISDEIKNWNHGVVPKDPRTKIHEVVPCEVYEKDKTTPVTILTSKLLGFYEYPCVIWRKVIIAMHTYSSFFKLPYLIGNNTVKHISKQTFVITDSEHYVFFYHSHINCTT